MSKREGHTRIRKMTPEIIERARMYIEKGYYIGDIAQLCGIGYSTAQTIANGTYTIENGEVVRKERLPTIPQKEEEPIKRVDANNDIMCNILFELRTANDLLNAMLEKWK